MKRNIVIPLAAAIVGSFLTFLLIKNAGWLPHENVLKIEHVGSPNSVGALYTTNTDGDIVPLDFTKVANQVMPAVVHIQSTQVGMNAMQPQGRDPFQDNFGEDFFERFFGPGQGPGNRGGTPPARVGTGSGVLISPDGYLVTNNHVIDQADDIEVVLEDNRTYKAQVVGTDPSTDLALLRIEDKGLPYLAFGNSDQVQVGQWVMAVGNPFNLNSTVTAGIVSAKGRNINILPNRSAIESFIQTDAAINPGNSGGALVDLNGGLVGINTAIASPTGSYAGYGFAVPVNIVEKVVADLKQFGVVQRGFLGIMIRDVDGNLAREKDLSVTAGVYVDSLLESSAAREAGLKVGDVIVAVEDKAVKKSPELQELVGLHRPGDKVSLRIDRSGQEKVLIVTLNNQQGTTEAVHREHAAVLSRLGADFETLDTATAKKLDIPGGVRVSQLFAGKLRQQTQMKEGFIITHVNQQPVKTVEELVQRLETLEGGIMLEGRYENVPGNYYYAFGL